MLVSLHESFKMIYDDRGHIGLSRLGLGLLLSMTNCTCKNFTHFKDTCYCDIMQTELKNKAAALSIMRFGWRAAVFYTVKGIYHIMQISNCDTKLINYFELLAI